MPPSPSRSSSVVTGAPWAERMRTVASGGSPATITRSACSDVRHGFGKT